MSQLTASKLRSILYGVPGTATINISADISTCDGDAGLRAHCSEFIDCFPAHTGPNPHDEITELNIVVAGELNEPDLLEDCERSKLSLEQMLFRLHFTKLEVVHQGSGWVGRRFRLHTCSDGYVEAETFKELRRMIVDKWAWQLRSGK